MEPSRTDELEAGLYTLLRDARREASYLPLHRVAALLVECLEPEELFLLADLLADHDTRRSVAEVGA
jgi:hypothetical protein